MSRNDFMDLTVDEFNAICKAYNSKEERLMQDRWEIMRMQATISIQPHVKGTITPQKLLPFYWDKKNTATKKDGIKKLTQEERRKRIDELESKLV